MPDRSGEDLEIIRNRSAAGGVNSFAFAYDIGDNEAVELQNIDASTPGVRRSRAGTTLVATGITHGPILAMSAFQAVNAETELLVVSPGATFPDVQHLKLWSWDGFSTTFTLKGTLTGFTNATLGIQIIPGIDINSFPSKPYLARIFSQQSQQIAYAYDGTSLVSTTATHGAPRTGMFPAAYVLNRCFASADGTERSHVYFTDVGMFCFTGWSQALSVTMGGGARQLIRNIQPFRNQDLVIFMADRVEILEIIDAMSTVTGYTNWTRGVIDANIGCAGHKAVASTGQDLLFADQYGNVRSINRTITDNQQGVKSRPISTGIQAYIDRINPTAMDKVVAQFYDHYVIFGFPLDQATEVSHSFAWDTVNDAWYGPWTGLFPAKSMAVATMSSTSAASKHQNPSLYLGAPTTTGGMVYHAFDGNSDSGNPIISQETTRRYNGGGLEAPNFFRRLKDFYQATGSDQVTVEARKDGGAWTKLGTAVDLTGDVPELPLTFPFSFGGNGVVKKTFSLEQFGERVQDMQFRYTATATAEIRHLGFSVTFHRKNFDWKTD